MWRSYVDFYAPPFSGFIVDFSKGFLMEISDYYGEIWMPIDEVPGYSVSDWGRVRNDRFNRILLPHPTDRDVLMVNLSFRGYSLGRSVKRLVADAFIPKAPFYEYKRSCIVRHIDEDWTNCRADNLNWALRSDAAWIKRVGVSWGRPVMAMTSGVVYEDAVEAARHYQYGCDISIKRICMLQEGWHAGETFRWADQV